MAETLVWIVVAFHLGAAAKTWIDAGLYSQGVREGYRVAQGDIDASLDDARRVIHDSDMTEERQSHDR